jgi:hypothetical protein
MTVSTTYQRRSKRERGVERRWKRGGEKELAFDNAHVLEGIRASLCTWVAGGSGFGTTVIGAIVTGAIG